MSLYLRTNFLLFLWMTLLLGFIYPGVSTLVVQSAFHHQSQGSLIERNGKILGSELIGQNFTDPKYFWGGYLPLRRSLITPPVHRGSNLSPANPALLDNIKARIEALKNADPKNTQSIPVDLVTASGSGLDPHISVEAAEYQASRIARIRNMRETQIDQLIKRHTQDRQFGILGEPRVNVLMLNLDLDGKL